LQGGGERDGAQRAVRGDRDVEGLGHRGDLAGLQYASGVREIGLHDIHVAVDQHPLEVPAGIQPLAQSYRGGGVAGDLAQDLLVPG
jgi:hypothetical protein